MKEFKRGINEKFYDQVKEFWSSGIGKKIIDCEYTGNKQFHVCLRKNYFNVYWRGCSVLKYRPNAKKHVYTIHYKYIGIGKPLKDDPYVDLQYSSDDLKYPGKNWSFRENILIPAEKGKIECLSDYVKGKKNKGEKYAISYYLEQKKPCLIDLEIAFTRRKDKYETKKREMVADRIDLARIVMKDDIPTLQFVEVKLVDDSRLRKKNGDSEIFNQMRRYKEELIDKQKKHLLDSYKIVAKNMLDFGLARNEIEWFKLFIEKGRIDDQPYLILIGDISGLTTGKYGNHWEKICQWDYPKPEVFPIPESN